MARKIEFVKDNRTNTTKILIDGIKRGFYWKASYGEYVGQLDYWNRNKHFKTENGLKRAIIRETNKYSKSLVIKVKDII